MNTIYCLGNDLRIDDNPALLAECKSDSLDLVYWDDPRWFETGRYKLPTLGIHRWSFLRQALQDFDRSVQSMGQRLLVAYEAPERFLPRLAERLAANRLVCSRRFSSESNQMLAEIKVVAPELLIEQYEGYTLLSEAQLPFDLGNLPETYSKFRRQVESVAINLPMNAVTTMPRQSTTGSGLVSESLACDGSDFEGGQFKGGEAAANEHLVTYLNSHLQIGTASCWVRFFISFVSVSFHIYIFICLLSLFSSFFISFSFFLFSFFRDLHVLCSPSSTKGAVTIHYIRRVVMKFFFELGRYLLFLRSMFFKPERFSVFVERTLHEMNNIGVGSLPIVAIISIFVGAVTTVQTA